MLVKLDHFPKDWGEHKKYLKPPPSFILLLCVLFCFLDALDIYHDISNKKNMFKYYKRSIKKSYTLEDERQEPSSHPWKERKQHDFPPNLHKLSFIS